MFTLKDIETRSVFVINCIEKRRNLRVNTGELQLEEEVGEKKITLTKFPFQKVLALFIIGHITITTPLIEKCKRFGVALIVMKPNLRPVFYWDNMAEANYLLRNKQHHYPHDDLSIARQIVFNKIINQKSNLLKMREKDPTTTEAINQCEASIQTIDDINDYNQLMGLEGVTSRMYFAAYFQSLKWDGRHPRMKSDELNVTLDIGYTLLFNYIECFLRMYGFDLYVGVYHRLWFKRKSLVCDIMEPFRCIIDHATLLAYNRKKFSTKDFEKKNKEYFLKREKSADYYRVFIDALIAKKSEVFKYVQLYYRCFMGRKSVSQFPTFKF